ncbi:MAG: hypothetical protein NDI80_10510 [Flavobacteriaceae bacterium]|nr:hypothetical protein [Flavobacteriaceae bacterium]
MAILVTVQFTIAALPGYFFYLQKLYNLDILELLRVVSPLTFLQSLIAFLISALVLFKLEKDSLIKNRKIMILSIVSVILAFAMNSMYGLTSKYREWVMLGQPAYVGTFFSSLLFTIFFAILFCQLLDIVSERFNFLLRIVSVLVFALGISLITVLIGISNQQVSAQQSEMSSKLQLIDLFINSDLYKTLNEMDVIVGPVLFKGPPGFSDYDWSDYLKYKTGKEINLVKSISDKKVFNRRFNLDIVKVGSDNLNNILVVYDVLPMNLSNNLYIFSGKKGVINITGKYKPSGKGIFKVTSDNLIRYSFNKEIFSAEVSGNNIKILTSEPFEIYSVQVNRNMTPTNFFQM